MKPLDGQLSLLEGKRWSSATVAVYLRLPDGVARTHAIAYALGNGISRSGSRASFAGGRDQVASVIGATKRKRICAVLGIDPDYFSRFARYCEKRYYVGHRCEWGVLTLWKDPFMEICPGCQESQLGGGRIGQSVPREQDNQSHVIDQSVLQTVPIPGDAMRDGKGDA